MSEYQYVAFRAIDGEVTGKDLEFMQKQSSRAQITPRSFENEYHHGDFRGNAEEMLRRGYDIHLHYANFGIRKLMIRLPGGFPDPKAAESFLTGDGCDVIEDQQGPGITLEISPFYEAGELEDVYDVDTVIDHLAPLRAEILEGDLRPLFLARLAVVCDMNHAPDEETEGPIPAGLKTLTSAQKSLVDFYGIDPYLIEAVAAKAPNLPAKGDRSSDLVDWLRSQSPEQKDRWLLELIQGEPGPLRRQIRAEFNQHSATPAWPVVEGARTIAQLQTEAEELRTQAKLKSAAAAAKKRDQELAKMAASPDRYFEKAKSLIEEFNTDSYAEASKILADLREALSASGQAERCQQFVMQLAHAHPTKHSLRSALKKAGFEIGKVSKTKSS
jgi:hypothetical protein